MRFRVPELFLGCFLTVAVYSMGLVFVSSRYAPPATQQVTLTKTSEQSERAKTPDSDLTWAWLTKDAAGFFAFVSALIVGGQALMFFLQLRYMRIGMRDATIAAESARDAARTAIAANKINRDNFLAENRPWLGPNDKFAFTQPFSPVKGGYATQVEFQVMNAGRSPALQVQIVAELYLLDGDRGMYAIPERFKKKLADFSKWGGGSVVFPDDAVTAAISLSLTDEEVGASAIALKGSKTFLPLIWVGVAYVSSQGTQYFTSAVYRMGGAFVGMEIPVASLQAGLTHCEAT